MHAHAQTKGHLSNKNNFLKYTYWFLCFSFCEVKGKAILHNENTWFTNINIMNE